MNQGVVLHSLIFGTMDVYMFEHSDLHTASVVNLSKAVFLNAVISKLGTTDDPDDEIKK